MLGLDSTFDFGKYRGKTVLEVLDSDLSYLLFLRRPKTDSAYGGKKLPMSEELHLTLDAQIYANGGKIGTDKPRFDKAKVDRFLSSLEYAVELKEAEAEGAHKRAMSTYGELWGCFG